MFINGVLKRAKKWQEVDTIFDKYGITASNETDLNRRTALLLHCIGNPQSTLGRYAQDDAAKLKEAGSNYVTMRSMFLTDSVEVLIKEGHPLYNPFCNFIAAKLAGFGMFVAKHRMHQRKG